MYVSLCSYLLYQMFKNKHLQLKQTLYKTIYDTEIEVTRVCSSQREYMDYIQLNNTTNTKLFWFDKTNKKQLLAS